MALLFHPSFARLYIGRGLLANMASPHAITIYSGARPTAANLVTNFASYNSTNTNFLAHYQGAVWTQSSQLASLTTIPAAVNASNTGTGSWAVLWGTNPTLASMNGAIPTSIFVVVDVSNGTGTGVLRFADLTFTSGVSKVIQDGSIGAAVS